MTQEEKQVLIKDLSARLPYGIFVYDKIDNKSIYTISYHPHIDNCKPYLRPMSSMSEEERKYYNQLSLLVADGESDAYEETDWLNAHHFDYRGLIEKGLALEAPEGTYKTE